MKKTKRFIALLTCVTMTATMIPAFAFAATSGPEHINPGDVTSDDIIERDTDSTTYDLGGGESMKVIYDGDIRFEDDDGSMVDYDPSLQDIKSTKSDNGEDLTDYSYENKTGDSTQYIPERIGEDAPLLMEKDNFSISMSMTDDSAKSLGIDNAKVKTEKEEITTASQDIVSLPVDAVFSSNESELKYTSMTDGVKEEVTLNEKPESNVIEYSLNLPGLNPKVDSMGGITITEDGDEDKIVAGIAPAWMNDATSENYSENIKYELEKVEGSYKLRMVIDEEYLENASYPVTIDPTVSWTGDSKEKDAYVISGSTYGSKNFYASSTIVMPAGKNSMGTHRTYISFPSLASTVSGKSITSAKLTCYERNTGVKGQYIGTYKVTSSWSPSKITWNNKPSHNTTRMSRVTVTNVKNTAQVFDLLSYVKGVASGTKDYGIALINCSATTKYASFFGGRASSYKPKLAITYYSKPTTASSASLSEKYLADSTKCKVNFNGIKADGADCNVQYAIYSHVDESGDNTSYSAYSEDKTIKSGDTLPSLQEGCYEVFVRGVNTAGVAGGAKSCGIIHVDKTAPIADLNIPDSTEEKPGSASPEVKWSVTSEKHLKEIQYKF